MQASQQKEQGRSRNPKERIILCKSQINQEQSLFLLSTVSPIRAAVVSVSMQTSITKELKSSTFSPLIPPLLPQVDMDDDGGQDEMEWLMEEQEAPSMSSGPASSSHHGGSRGGANGHITTKPVNGLRSLACGGAGGVEELDDEDSEDEVLSVPGVRVFKAAPPSSAPRSSVFRSVFMQVRPRVPPALLGRWLGLQRAVGERKELERGKRERRREQEFVTKGKGRANGSCLSAPSLSAPLPSYVSAPLRSMAFCEPVIGMKDGFPKPIREEMP